MGTEGTDVQDGTTGDLTADASAAADEPAPQEPDGSPAEPPHRRRALRRVLISLGVLGLVLALVIGGGLWFLTSRWGGNIDRVADVFGNLDQGSRPAPATAQQG